MTAAVESMAFSGETPWHGLGNKVSDNMTPDQMRKEAGLDWTVSKRPVYWQPNGKNVLIKDKELLVRDSDDMPLCMVSPKYKPVQNDVAIDFFKKFVKAGKMKMETAGSLWNGRYIWCLARCNADFAIGKNDEVRSYLLLCQPHMIGRAMVIQFTPIRVVCWNTLTFALGHDLKGKGNAFRMSHATEFTDEVKEQAEQALGLAGEQVVEFKEAAILLSKKKAPAPKVEEFFCDVLKFDPRDQDTKKKKDGTAQEPRMLPMFRQALTHAPGQQIGSAMGTWWGALNAVTYVIDHQIGRQDRSTTLHNVWLGPKATQKRRALDLALKAAA